jgi:NAD+ kinase
LKLLELLYEKEIVKKEYKLFFIQNQSFDMLISIGGDGTILRAATLIRDSEFYLGINAGRLGFWQRFKRETSMNFYNCY